MTRENPTYFKQQMEYSYQCYRIGNKIYFNEFNRERNAIIEKISLDIKKLQQKEIFKKLNIKELTKLKKLIEEILQEKLEERTCN